MAPRNDKKAGESVVLPQENKSSPEPTTAGPIGDSVIQVDDKLYSAQKLAETHPGGELFVRAFAGKDATDAFLSYHRRNFPHHLVKSALIGEKSATHSATFDKDYIELCGIIEKVLPRHKSFAPISYFVKIFLLLGAAIGIELYMHKHRAYNWPIFGILGLLSALIGLNIQHDANHGSISRYPLINRVLGLTQNWIGGSHLDWIHQHVVQHHVHTNDIHTDPDIVGNPIIRINPRSPLMKWHMFQYLYVFVLLAVFGVNYSFNSVYYAVRFGNFTAYSNMLRKYQGLDLFFVALFHLRLTVMPLLFSGDRSLVLTMCNMMMLYVVGGYYLSFFFLISHNFDGVHMFDSTKPTKANESFLYAQVTSSCNVGGALLGTLNGGLNYQIEHHLFPRIQHTHYPLIAPYVAQFCKVKGIPYVHFPTIVDNVRATALHLFRMGTEENPDVKVM